jgi:AraC-like DNA-binding protein
MADAFDDWPHPRLFHVIAVATSVETPRTTYGPFPLDRYGLAWIVEGGGTTLLDEANIDTSPGTVMLMRPGMRLRHNWGRARSFQSFIVFDFEAIEPPWPMPSTWPLARTLAPDDALFAMWRFVLASWQASLARPRHDPLMVAAVELMLRMVVTGASGSGALTEVSLPAPVEVALAFIQDHVTRHPAEPLRLAAIARRVHVSEQHLCRLFKRSLGESPLHCAQLLRLEQAGSLLDRTELSVAEIAERLGFSSQFHFSRSFKQGYGLSPTAYRTAFREGSASRPAGLVYRHHRLRHYVYERAPGKVRG